MDIAEEAAVLAEEIEGAVGKVIVEKSPLRGFFSFGLADFARYRYCSIPEDRNGLLTNSDFYSIIHTRLNLEKRRAG